VHTPYGQDVLKTFLRDVCDGDMTWSAANIVEEQVARIREQVGDARVICGLSGGVDSAVAAAIVHEAVGDQLTCIFVDHGLLRADERRQVEEDYVASTGVRLVTVDAVEQFMDALAGVSDPEQKRKIIGREFIRTFENAAEALVLEAAAGGEPIRFLVQGTLYPDVVESGGGSGTANIKSHHNVGGLPEDLQFELIEPLRTLFKDEVRAIGRELGLPEAIVGRQPFPGPGLGIRIVGEVTHERLELLRQADAIVRAELTATPAGRGWWIADAEPYEVNDIVATVGRALEAEGFAVAPNRARLPAIAGRVAERVDAVVQRTGRYVQPVHVLGEMDKTIACDIAAARAELGYEPTVALEDGMRQSIRWCVAQGLEL